MIKAVTIVWATLLGKIFRLGGQPRRTNVKPAVVSTITICHPTTIPFGHERMQ